LESSSKTDKINLKQMSQLSAALAEVSVPNDYSPSFIHLPNVNKNLESPAEAKPTAPLKGAKEEQTFTI